MKKDAKQFITNMRQSVYNSLTKQAILNNQSKTKYVETLIIKKEKFQGKIRYKYYI